MEYNKSRVSEMLSFNKDINIKKTKTKLLNFKIDEELYNQFKNVCEKKNITMTDILKQYIEDIVERS